MITSISSSRMVVISDLHLGNPFSSQSRKIFAFIRWAAAEGYDVCVNGDGLEIAQSSFAKMTMEVPEFLRALADVRKAGREAYYVVGNHDIALEHFLDDWGMMKASPFLNVASGGKRIRIEHGHLYDPFFVKHPHLYEFLTRLGAIPLRFFPKSYRLWIRFERWKSGRRAKRTGITGEPQAFAVAAAEIARRGFDAVVFGHTHHAGQVNLEEGARYLNPGSWLLTPHYVEINDGEVSLKTWSVSRKTTA
jgi:UDP-2,3-diacylglucosamine pyrophosphatase LpxH